MRSRAYRRHKRAVKLARRYRIMQSMSSWYDSRLNPRMMHAHIRCNCFEDPRESILRRRRDERAWRQEWDA